MNELLHDTASLPPEYREAFESLANTAESFGANADIKLTFDKGIKETKAKYFATLILRVRDVSEAAEAEE